MKMPTEHKVVRKLTAILSADVKGYSLLMADDETQDAGILPIVFSDFSRKSQNILSILFIVLFY